MGSKLDTKQMEVLSFNIWAGGAGEKWRRRVEQRSAASGGAHPKQQLGGVVINSIFLITRWSSMEVPLPSGRQQGKLLLSTKGTKESAGGAQGRRRREGAVEGIFHFHWKVKVTPTLSLLLFSWYICQCLKRARGRKYSTINVSKFLPASNCSRRLSRIQIMPYKP